jgi:hypothetical protein
MLRSKIFSIPEVHFTFSLLAFCLLTCVAHAQVSSAAFDPNCYQPVIGTPGVVDTIYGNHSLQTLGGGVFNLWHETGDPYGRVAYGTDTGASSLSVYPIFTTGPKFDLHHLNIVDTFPITEGIYDNYPGYIVKRAHYRSSRYLDILFAPPGNIVPPRIYWVDDKGKYDSSRFTDLKSPISGSKGVSYNEIYVYTDHMSSDSVYDVIFGITLDYGSQSIDSTFFLYFKGGNSLYSQGKTVYADSVAFLDTFGMDTRYLTQGDFRGIGREDLMASNGLNVFYYRNDSPFSMTKFISSMKYDTLMARWQNPKGCYLTPSQFTMRAFKKQPGDSSVDFLPNINDGNIRIYRGGPDFGSRRLFDDSADFVIHHPSVYDQLLFIQLRRYDRHRE